MKDLLIRLRKEYHAWKNIIRVIFTKKDIPPGIINSSIKFGHGGLGVVISKEANIGNNCFIGQNVTIGIIKKGSKGKIKKGAPTIEDNVEINANACLIGGIEIGHNSIIGAGSIVYKDIPPNSLVVGDCKIYSEKYNKDKRIDIRKIIRQN